MPKCSPKDHSRGGYNPTPVSKQNPDVGPSPTDIARPQKQAEGKKAEPKKVRPPSADK